MLDIVYTEKQRLRYKKESEGVVYTVKGQTAGDRKRSNNWMRNKLWRDKIMMEQTNTAGVTAVKACSENRVN